MQDEAQERRLRQESPLPAAAVSVRQLVWRALPSQAALRPPAGSDVDAAAIQCPHGDLKAISLLQEEGHQWRRAYVGVVDSPAGPQQKPLSWVES